MIIGYKKVYIKIGPNEYDEKAVIAVLRVAPGAAVKFGSCKSDKCKASEVDVLYFESMTGKRLKATEAHSRWSSSPKGRLKYEKGYSARPNNGQMSIKKNLGPGIYFYLTKEEARNY